jgi:hypothetical protein
MAARIIYPTNTPWGAQVAELAAAVVKAQQLAARIVAAFNSMSSGGAGPWTAMESELGLQAGVGTTMYTTIHNAEVNLNAVTGMDTLDMGQ